MDATEPEEQHKIQDETAEVEAAVSADAPRESDESDREIERFMRRKTRRSFLIGGGAALAGLVGWRWLITRREEDGIHWPFRRALEINEQLARDYFASHRLAPAFPASMAKDPRANGDVGLEGDLDLANWRLHVEGLAGSDQPAELTLAEIKKLPRVETVTELKCIEGWSEIVHWAGARFADFAEKYPPATVSGDPPDVRNRPRDLAGYVSLETPDQEYYVGLDLDSALHPQTLLCYEMNGQPLTPEHGAPLRLVIPVKYGIKNIKRIATIRYTERRPPDYWAERGYDWYAGL